jgi:hypothetical protein
MRVSATQWKFLAVENPRPAAAHLLSTGGLKDRAKQLEEELQQQCAPALALDEFLDALGDMRQAGLSSPSPLEMCGESISATDYIIPSDRPEVTPIVTGRVKPRYVPSRQTPSSSVLIGGAAVAAPPREKGQDKLQAGHKMPVKAADYESNPAPIIIWRHAAPIKIATNVPPELLPPGQMDLYEPVLPLGESSCEASGRDSGPAAGSSKKAIKPRGTGYGAAWYLPVSQWEASAKGVDLGAKKELDEDGRTRVAKVSPGSKADGEEVVALYSSKRYVEYLREKKAARVPYYLADL